MPIRHHECRDEARLSPAFRKRKYMNKNTNPAIPGLA
jgi:hypothetical protein